MNTCYYLLLLFLVHTKVRLKATSHAVTCNIFMAVCKISAHQRQRTASAGVGEVNYATQWREYENNDDTQGKYGRCEA